MTRIATIANAIEWKVNTVLVMPIVVGLCAWQGWTVWNAVLGFTSSFIGASVYDIRHRDGGQS